MSENGILAQVEGQYIAMGSSHLPPAETAEDREHAVVMEAGHLGQVRLFYVRRLARHRRHRHWFWTAVRAELAP